MSDYQEQTKPCPVCNNGLIRIVTPAGKVIMKTCNRCGGTGRVVK